MKDEVISVNCSIVRGGTSKGIFIMENELPQDPALRDKYILEIFGSPDVRQIDGLGGADVLATSYTLSQAIRSVGDFDLILCGKQTTDGDTAQVGPAIAEHMGIPHAAWVSRIEAETNGVVVEQQLQDVIETVRMPFPCLVTVEQDIYMPRLPSLKTARRVADRPVHVMGLDSFLDTDPEHYGLSGSPTQVERIFPPENDVQREQWTEENAAEKLHGLLKQWKFV